MMNEYHSEETLSPSHKTFFEKYSKLIIFLLLLSLPIMGIGVSWSLQNMRNNMKEWLPGGSEEANRHSWFQKNFPMEQFILLSWEDCTLDDPRLPIMKERLLPRKEIKTVTENGETKEVEQVIHEDFNLRFYEKIQTGNDLIQQMLDSYPSMTHTEALERLSGSIIGMDKIHTGMMILLSPGSESANMKAPIGEIYRLARLEFVLDKSKLTAEQIAAAEAILEKNKNIKIEPANFLEKQSWARVPQKQLSEEERNQIAPENLLILPGLQPSQVHMGGPPTDNIAIDVEGTRTLLRLAWLSGIVGLTIAIIFLHSVRLVFIVFSTAIFATGYALASVSFSGVTTDAIMLSMPPLVYVLTMSSSIHIINYYHDAIAELGSVRGAPELALKHAFFPCVVCALTTALGLLSLLTSSLGPIYKFGLYSAWGVLLAMLMYLLYLPAMLHLFPSYGFLKKVKGHNHFETRSDLVERFWLYFGGKVVSHPYITLGVCLTLMTWGFLGLPKLTPSVKLMKFFISDTTIVKDYTWLEKTLGPLVPLEVVIRFDNELNHDNMLERLRLVERIAKTSRSHEEVGGILSVVTLAPDLKRSANSIRERTLDRRLSENYGRLREYVTYDLPAAERKYKQRTGKSPSLSEIGQEIEQLDIPELESTQINLPQQYAAILKMLAFHNIHTLEELHQNTEMLKEKKVLTKTQNTLLHNVIYLWQVEHGDELWRITNRVGALTDLDYGNFMPILQSVIDPVVEYHIKSHELSEYIQKLEKENGISKEDQDTLEQEIRNCQLDVRLERAFQSLRGICIELLDKKRLVQEDVKQLEDILEHFRVEQRSVITIPELEKLGEKFTRENKLTAEEWKLWQKILKETRYEEGDSLLRVKLLCTDELPSLTDPAARNALTAIIDKDVLSQDIRQNQPVEAIYTGAVPLVYKTQHELMKSLVESVLLAFVTIGVVMMLVLRNVVGGFLAMIPNIFPIVFVFGTMGHFNILLDLGAMMTASVALGIAVDDTIHFITWYRRGLDEGFDNRGAIVVAYRRCGTAMTETTFISGLGLAVFAFSTFTPTLTFGIMMLTLLTTATFGDLFFMPAILTGIGGHFFSTKSAKEIKEQSKTKNTADDLSQEASVS
ncbi:MAG: MMPL family transporter [Planctomycetia bacterium]|nr:MMPL family transporter [Planctomycetia bacterium]